jgi:hypothetical protein
VIAEIFSAVLMAGLPVGFCSYGLAWWTIRKGYIEPVTSVKALEQAVNDRRKDKKLKKQGDATHRKWLAFGGGFYGVVALLTYAIVELAEIRDFILGLGGILEMIRNLSLNVIINLFIGAFWNFIVAISWPAYWLNEVRGQNFLIWLAVAYAGYWVGVRQAVRNSLQAQASGD